MAWGMRKLMPDDISKCSYLQLKDIHYLCGSVFKKDMYVEMVVVQ